MTWSTSAQNQNCIVLYVGTERVDYVGYACEDNGVNSKSHETMYKGINL